MGAPEGSHEVAHVPLADPTADLLNRQVGLDQEAPRLHHETLDNPLLHRAARLTPDERGEVARRQATARATSLSETRSR